MDYRELLMKYIAHVGDCEGITYVHHIGQRSDSVKFTEDEKAELKRLDDESRKYTPR